MKKKIIASLVMGVFALMLLMSAVSALTLSSNSLNFNNVGGSQTLTISGDANFNVTSPTFPFVAIMTDPAGKTATLTITNTSLFNINPATFNVVLSNVPDGFSNIGSQTSTSFTLNATSTTGNASLNIPISFTKTFCKSGDQNISNLALSVDISNKGQGDSDTSWLPLDQIDVKVTLDNNDDTVDLRHVIFALGLYKKGTSSNVAGNLIWLSPNEDKFEVGNVDSGKSATHTFSFKVNPDIKVSSDYALVIKAYPKDKESTTCIDTSSDFDTANSFTTISIDQQTSSGKMIIVDTDSIPQPINALCGDHVSFTADVYNIGDTDFSDQTKVTLVNTELGLNLEQVLPGDFNSGDSQQVAFDFTVPANAAEKTYDLSMRTYYDYNTNNQDYNEVSDKEFIAKLKVAGGCVFAPQLTTAAELTSGGTAGQQMAVKVTVTNTASVARTFTVATSGYDSWATLVTPPASTLTLNAGQSKDVNLIFAVNSAASGQETFSLDLTDANNKVINEPVEVTVTKAGLNLFSGTGSVIGNNNWYVWAIGALNIVLVLIIILVAVRLVKK